LIENESHFHLSGRRYKKQTMPWQAPSRRNPGPARCR
ncbi:MAG: hypothetical protein ACI855_001011, partial [Myxococcota bacterium]